MFGETTISYVKICNYPTENNIENGCLYHVIIDNVYKCIFQDISSKFKGNINISSVCSSKIYSSPPA